MPCHTTARSSLTAPPRGLLRILLPIALAMVCSLTVAQDLPTGPDDRAPNAVEREAMNRIVGQPAGHHTLEAYNLPEDFTRRVAQHVIRSSYWEMRHVIVDEPPAQTAAREGGTPREQNARRTLWMFGIAATMLLAVLIVWTRSKRRIGAVR